jgi:hypothetical protein
MKRGLDSFNNVVDALNAAASSQMGASRGSARYSRGRHLLSTGPGQWEFKYQNLIFVITRGGSIGKSN